MKRRIYNIAFRTALCAVLIGGELVARLIGLDTDDGD